MGYVEKDKDEALYKLMLTMDIATHALAAYRAQHAFTNMVFNEWNKTHLTLLMAIGALPRTDGGIVSCPTLTALKLAISAKKATQQALTAHNAFMMPDPTYRRAKAWKHWYSEIQGALRGRKRHARSSETRIRIKKHSRLIRRTHQRSADEAAL